MNEDEIKIIKSVKGTVVKGEHFRMKSKTNSIQYISTGQAVQNMLNAGADKNIMAINNNLGANEIDISEISSRGLEINEYRNDKFDIIDTGRRADEEIKAEIIHSNEEKRNLRNRTAEKKD